MARKKKGEGSEETVQAGGGGRTKIVIAVLVLAVAGLGYKVVFAPKGPAKAEAKVKAEPTPGEVLDAGALTVNLADGGTAYARVGIGLVLDASLGGHATEVEAHVPLMKDAAISTISRFTRRELLAPRGQDELRHALTEAAHEIFHDAVIEVVLTEFTVQ